MESDTVRLRPLREADASLLYNWITDRELVTLNSAYHPVSEADHQAWIQSVMRKRSDMVIFVIEETETSEAIGSCQLLNIDSRHRSAELQIRIGEARHRGKGMGSAAVKLLTKFGFNDLNLHRIYLHVFATNDPAVRSYRKCGFEEEGRLRDAAFIDGAWVDVLVMGLLRRSIDG